MLVCPRCLQGWVLGVGGGRGVFNGYLGSLCVQTCPRQPSPPPPERKTSPSSAPKCSQVQRREDWASLEGVGDTLMSCMLT